MKATNLNMLFQSYVANFADVLTTSKQTKEEYLQQVKDNHEGPKTDLFIASCERSTFDTIRLNRERSTILFNQ